MKTRFLHALMAAALLLALPVQAAATGLRRSAAPQSAGLDPGFGGFGSASGFADIKNMTVQAITQDDQQRILVAGYLLVNPTQYIQVQRFNTDGSLDNGFSFSALVEGEPHAVAVDGSGRILVAGQAQNNFFLMRLKSSGALDTSLGLTGVVYADFDGQADSAEALGVQSNGSIVVGGWGKIGGDEDFAVARYLTNGSLDASFGGDGKVTTGFGSREDYAYALALLPGNGVLLAGTAYDISFGGSNFDFGVAKYLSDGSLDPGFDGDGKLTFGFSDSDVALSLALTTDGSQFVAAGCAHCYVYVTPDFNSDLAVARYNLNGTPDASFDGDGKASYPLSSYYDEIVQAFPHPDGSLTLVAATDLASQGVGRDTVLLQAAANSSLNPVFAYDFNAPAPLAALLQRDGKIVTANANGLYRYLPDSKRDQPGVTVADFEAAGNQAQAVLPIAGGYYLVGETQTSGIFNQQVSLSLYNDYGQLVPEFGDQGIGLAGGPGDDFVRSAALDSQGRVVAAGFWGSTNSDFAVYRFAGSGLDPAFHSLGYTFTDFGLGNDYAQAVLLQPQANGSQKIVAAGFAFDGVTYDAALARYNDNGSLDSTFGSQGKVRQDLGTGFVRIRAALVQADRKLLVVGGHAGDFVAVRFLPDGDLDPSFGGDGIVEVTLGGNDEARAVALYPNNLLLVAGYTSGDFGWVMLNQSDGSLCACGSISGIYKADFGGEETPYAVLVQPDGKILLAGGNNTTYPGSSGILLARWRKSFPTQIGYELDPTFGVGGQMNVVVEDWSSAQSMAFDWLNRLVVAGAADNRLNLDEVLLRLTGVAPPPSGVTNNAVFVPLLNR